MLETIHCLMKKQYKSSIMKKQKLITCILAASMIFVSCKKTTESVVDCLSEDIRQSVHVTVNANNPKEVTTEVKYWGTKTIGSIKWEYRDGVVETTTSLTGMHTYSSAGNYTIKAKITITEGKSSCASDHTKTVTIQ